MNYEHDQYYKAELIGVKHVELGKNSTRAIQFAVRMEDGKHDEVNKFLSGGAFAITQKNLIELGCEPDDLLGETWLKKINARIGGMAVVCKAQGNGTYGVRLEAIYKPKSFAKEVTTGGSPFDTAAPSNDDFGTIPGGDDLPY